MRAALALLLSLVAAGQASRPEFDLLIRNGRIVDGTGAPARAADVGVRDGRIAAIGRLTGATAADVVDASGLIVAPGFIDVHTHADDIARRPAAENFVRMGVTTIVAGNCGTSALRIGDALGELSRTGITVNYATLIGHNTVRAAVLGSAERAPSIGELDRMRSLIFDAMAEGAIGFSTGLQYVPGIYARSNEIVELARVAANAGGIYATHMRNEGTALEDAVAESIRVAELVDIRLQISHLKVDSPKHWGRSAAALRLIEEARARGVRVAADQYAYTAGASSLSIRFPSWVLEGGANRIRERLNDEATWTRVKKEMLGLLAERGFEDLAWATVASYRADPSLNGLSMRDVAGKLLSRTDVDAQLEAARRLMLGGGASMVYHFMSDDDVSRIMRHPLVGIASDSGVLQAGAGTPHPRGNGNTARVLAEFVRDRKVLTLEEAVRKMTSLPAAHFGFNGRGTLVVGAMADVVVFDAARVADRATYASPHASPAGMPHVFVNGAAVVRAGVPTAARPGTVVRR
jgi:N-acyl-D-amino-acid deacylase